MAFQPLGAGKIMGRMPAVEPTSTAIRAAT